MKRFAKQATGAVLLSAALLIAPALAKPNKDDIVGKVTSVQGDSLQVKRDGDKKWNKTTLEDPSFVKDHFKTDVKTSAALDLFVGARVGIKKNSEIVLLSEGEAAVVDGKNIRQIDIKSGGVWAKFDKQDKPITIKTKGGVMGIKGTEFTVETAEDGRTDVVLLEGSVDYTEEKEGGKTYEVQPGQKLSQFEKDGETYTVAGEPSEVDQKVGDFLSGVLNIGEIDSVQDVLYKNWAAIPSDVVNSGIDALRQKTLDSLGIPPEIQSLVSTYVYDPTGYTNYVNNVLPSLPSYNSLFSVPGLPSSFPFR